MGKNELENLEVSLDFLKERGACSPAITEFEKFGKEKVSLSEVFNWVKENKKSGWEAWLIAQPEYCKALIKAGADVHAGGDIALRMASWRSNLETVKFLVGAGANINVDDGFPLGQAALHGDLEMVKFLVGAGANTHAGGDYAFKVAVWHGKWKVALFLVNYLKTK